MAKDSRNQNRAVNEIYEELVQESGQDYVETLKYLKSIYKEKEKLTEETKKAAKAQQDTLYLLEDEQKLTSKLINQAKAANKYRDSDLITKKKILQQDIKDLELAKTKLTNEKAKEKAEELRLKKLDRIKRINEAIENSDKKRLGLAEKIAKQ